MFTTLLNRVAKTAIRPTMGRFLQRSFSGESKAMSLVKDASQPIAAIRVASATNGDTLFKNFTVTPVTASIGAEIKGVKLSSDLSQEIIDELWEAFLMFGVIFFKDQHLEPDAHVALAKRFGKLDRHPIVEGMPDQPDVLQIVREAGAETNFGETWHSDNSYMANPSLGSILYSVEVPPVGNDTLFACAYTAYDGLSPALKKMLDGMNAIHTAGVAFAPDSVSGGSFDDESATMKYKKSEELSMLNLHPVVRTHPETGRKAIYVNSMFTTQFEGMTESESKALLLTLFNVFSLSPHLQCRYRWDKGDVAMWDNRAVQHMAIGDNTTDRRVMRRVTLEGDRPFYKEN